MNDFDYSLNPWGKYKLMLAVHLAGGHTVELLLDKSSASELAKDLRITMNQIQYLPKKRIITMTYQDESGRLGFCNITPRITEFEYGRSRLAYRIDTTWYDDKKAFIRALRNFAFGPTLPETKQEQ